ncbi:hypothetical protein EmuJ_000363500 [Echinococcus multilocularis]|uniref:Uncharacterized protein n=1 Tax=Echinococcus multilocularis TaxID=6211 RepID=A0A068Y351_ECHMU|nr:hypothetical protein EmuJ_000363500 [Echinococcus multilocularis]
MKVSTVEFIGVAVVSVLLNAIVSTATSSTSSSSLHDGSNVTIRIIPSIVSLPAPVTYLDGSHPDLSLTCEVWPPTANISFFIAHPSIIPTASRTPLALDLISPDATGALGISRRVSTPPNASFDGGVLAFSNASSILTVRGGGGLPEVSTPSGFTNTRVQEFISGNTAFVSCRIPPDSQPPPTVQFYLNETALLSLSVYRSHVGSFSQLPPPPSPPRPLHRALHIELVQQQRTSLVGIRNPTNQPMTDVARGTKGKVNC